MSPPKTVNKSKISTTFNKDFIPTKLKKFQSNTRHIYQLIYQIMVFQELRMTEEVY